MNYDLDKDLAELEKIVENENTRAKEMHVLTSDNRVPQCSIVEDDRVSQYENEEEEKRLLRAWELFQEFEEFCYTDRTQSMADFLAEWEARQEAALAVGCEYSEAVLAFKLLSRAGLEEPEAVLVSLLAAWRRRDGMLLNQLKLYLAAQQEPEEEPYKNLLKVEVPGIKQELTIRDTSKYEDEPESVIVNDGRMKTNSRGAVGRRLKCQQCSFQAARAAQLRAHVQAAHAPPNPLACVKCDYVAVTGTDLKRHRRTEHAAAKHVCSQCGYRSSDPSKLERHVRVSHEPEPQEEQDEYNGEVDGYPVDSNDLLYDRLDLEDGGEIGSLICDLCGLEAASKKALRQHAQTEHEGVRFECGQCTYVARSRGTLRRHQQSAHEGVKYPCDQCTYMATAPNALKRHIQSIHEQVKHPCDQCSYKACDASTLKKHKQYKHEGVRYACELCTHQATTTQGLKNHVKFMHEGVRLPCQQCGYQAAGHNRLRHHIQSVHQGVVHHCDQCTYSAKSRRMLSIHRQSKHEGVRYFCDQCDYQAPTSGALNVHKRSIHEQVRHPCDQCDHRATTPASLKLHIKVHHAEGTIPCGQCTFMATSTGRLKKHVRAAHEGKKYFYCNLCDVMTTKSCSLAKHKKLKHPQTSLMPKYE